MMTAKLPVTSLNGFLARAALVALTGLLIAGCSESGEDRWYIENSRYLVMKGADRQMVRETLGDDVFFEGEDLLNRVEQFVTSRKKQQIRELAKANSSGSFYSTMNVTIFILYDKNGKAVELLSGPQ